MTFETFSLHDLHVYSHHYARQETPMARRRKFTAFIFVFAAFFLVAVAKSEPALWVVKGPHATVYLFGTVHALDKEHSWRSAKIDAAIQ